jgi:translation elongation factor EF-Ts
MGAVNPDAVKLLQQMTGVREDACRAALELSNGGIEGAEYICKRSRSNEKRTEHQICPRSARKT